MVALSSPKFEIIGEQRDSLGECPILSPDQSTLFWIDGEEPAAIQRLDITSGQVKRWTMPRRIGSFALAQGGGALVALQDGVSRFDFATGGIEPLARVEQPDHFFLNDGRCDRQGRFFVTTMNLAMLNGDRASGPVYRLDADGLVPVIDGIIAGNGMAFSPEGTTMYVGCSLQSTIWALDLDPDDGSLSNRRIFAVVDRPGCFLDGAAIDDDGCYWVCIYGAGLIERYTPDGRLDRVVELPVTRPTMLGMPNDPSAGTFVTSGRVSDRPGMKQLNMLDGSLLHVELAISGPPEPLARPVP